MVQAEVVSNFISVGLLAPIYNTVATFPESCHAAKFMISAATVYSVPLQKMKGNITAPSPRHEGCHCAGLSWSQVHFTEIFWQIPLQHMRKRGVQRFT